MLNAQCSMLKPGPSGLGHWALSIGHCHSAKPAVNTVDESTKQSGLPNGSRM